MDNEIYVEARVRGKIDEFIEDLTRRANAEAPPSVAAIAAVRAHGWDNGWRFLLNDMPWKTQVFADYCWNSNCAGPVVDAAYAALRPEDRESKEGDIAMFEAFCAALKTYKAENAAGVAVDYDAIFNLPKSGTVDLYIDSTTVDLDDGKRLYLNHGEIHRVEQFLRDNKMRAAVEVIAVYDGVSTSEEEEEEEGEIDDDDDDFVVPDSEEEEEKEEEPPKKRARKTA